MRSSQCTHSFIEECIHCIQYQGNPDRKSIMAIKENEQPTFIHGTITETAINTFSALEIQVPRVLGQRLLFDVDEVFIDVERARPTLGADAHAGAEAQVVISENEPTALLTFDDPRILAATLQGALANATDVIWEGRERGNNLWETITHANLVPDDKVWLVVQGTGNRAGHTLSAWCRIKGKLAKVSQDDFEALILSRLGQ